ncbi:MAG: hypothetical protein H5U26_11740 [Immundisolibacter sp.]|uniref:hypothetical protein n=1 Tax=Immundisolibacter sp. TaxID=1934948 RepID=UPI0019AF4ED3|nr:hypothetical protein [Immundisolibacter sp.]MBC7162762.1 hypothetical protein [Immundisolibacter sp.]
MNSAEHMADYKKPASFGDLRLDEVFGYVVFFLMIASVAITPFRYFNYSFPLVAVLVILANRHMRTTELARPYLVVVLAGIALIPLANRQGIQDIYLVLTGLSLTLVGHRRLWSWNTIFLASILGLITNVAARVASDGAGAVLSHVTFDVAASKSTFESGFSYVFGLLAVWAAYTRRWRSFALAFMFALLTLKRIVILGIFLCFVLQFFPRPMVRSILQPLPMLLANALFIVLILSYGSGSLNFLIHELTGQSADQFGMGRQGLYGHVVVDIFRDPGRFLLMGMGPGQVYDALEGGMAWVGKGNLHADTLKIFYEYGGVVLTMFVWALYSSRRLGVLLVALYTNVLLLTDNTLIYPFYIFFATLVAASLQESDDANATSKAVN